jgi:N-acetylglucosaminyl-diphospho-decaprenol L-rhamnosyltransferase
VPVDGLTSIVVVAADSGPLLGTCIESALNATARIEVILVDNASSDGEVDRVAARHADEPRLRVIRNRANIGFGPAANVGATDARGDAILVLNPDCRLQASTVARMRSALATDRAIGVLGVNVRDPDGAPARANRRRDPTMRRAALEMSGMARLERPFRRLAGVEVRTPPVDDRDLEDVDAVSGACMMLPHAIYDRVGGFDAGYFLHVEDLDLCRRVRDAGLRVVFAQAIDVVHEQGSSSRKRPWFVMAHKHRGMWRYFVKFDPAARNPLWRALVALSLTLHAIAAAIACGLRQLRFRRD